MKRKIDPGVQRTQFSWRHRSSGLQYEDICKCEPGWTCCDTHGKTKGCNQGRCISSWQTIELFWQGTPGRATPHMAVKITKLLSKTSAPSSPPPLLAYLGERHPHLRWSGEVPTRNRNKFSTPEKQTWVWERDCWPLKYKIEIFQTSCTSGLAAFLNEDSLLGSCAHLRRIFSTLTDRNSGSRNHGMISFWVKTAFKSSGHLWCTMHKGNMGKPRFVAMSFDKLRKIWMKWVSLVSLPVDQVLHIGFAMSIVRFHHEDQVPIGFQSPS